MFGMRRAKIVEMPSRVAGKIRRFDAHETARVQSLEGVLLAGFGERLAAFAIDFFVVLAVYVPVELLKQYLELKEKRLPVHIALGFSLRELEDLIYLVIYCGLCLWLSNGQTLGKRLLRIRVLSLKGSKMTLWQSLERSLGYGASTLEAGFGFLQFFINRNRQCTHDRIAETIVVREPHKPKPGPKPPAELRPKDSS
jgi:uncharacterized RDD family membrane protein YckC